MLADHHRLVERRVQRRVDRERLAVVGDRGQRQRDDRGVGVARLRELQRLLDVLAVDHARLERAPDPDLLQRGLGGDAVGRVVGVGDRDLGEPRIGEILELAGRRDRARRPHHEPAAGVERAAVAGAGAVGDEAVGVRDVGGGEQIERRALAELLGEQPGRAEGEHRLDPGAGLERGADLGERAGQVGGGRDVDLRRVAALAPAAKGERDGGEREGTHGLDSTPRGRGSRASRARDRPVSSRCNAARPVVRACGRCGARGRGVSWSR